MASWLRMIRVWLGEAMPPLIFLGVVLLGLSFVATCAEWVAQRGELYTTATVNSITKATDVAQNVVATPHVLFRAADGGIVDFNPRSKGFGIDFVTGESVVVRYRVGNPQAAKLGDVWHVYSVACALGIAGILLFDLGVALRLWLRRRLRRDTPTP